MIETTANTEVWQRGPVPNIPPLLQPVAHALLQAREEIIILMDDFPEDRLWKKPCSMACPGFHLQHVSGVLDRVFTYARNEVLSELQMDALKAEDICPNAEYNVKNLLERFNNQVDAALLQLEKTDVNTLTDFRGVGRKQMPSTVIGLLFHGAEHIMRHVGQLYVTANVLKC